MKETRGLQDLKFFRYYTEGIYKKYSGESNCPFSIDYERVKCAIYEAFLHEDTFLVLEPATHELKNIEHGSIVIWSLRAPTVVELFFKNQQSFVDQALANKYPSNNNKSQTADDGQSNQHGLPESETSRMLQV